MFSTEFSPDYAYKSTTSAPQPEEQTACSHPDKRRLPTVQAAGYRGGYYNGRNASAQALVQYRFQPYGSISVGTDYNNIRLSAPYKSARYLLVGPRLALTFSRKLFWISYLQFNSQTNNTLLNTRVQWRYAPVPDLFVVYPENCIPGSLRSRNRTL